MTKRTVVEQDFLNDVGEIEGFLRRTDGKIEREVFRREPNIVTIRGEYYDLVEIISEDDYLIYMRDEIEDEEERRGQLEEYTEK